MLRSVGRFSERSLFVFSFVATRNSAANYYHPGFVVTGTPRTKQCRHNERRGRGWGLSWAACFISRGSRDDLLWTKKVFFQVPSSVVITFLHVLGSKSATTRGSKRDYARLRVVFSCLNNQFLIERQ